jgi:hypothetical protein
MQRVVLIVAVFLLVAASIGVGALTANWPFWRRAWTWHAAEGGWPSALPGPHAVVRGGGGAPLQFASALPDLAAAATTARTRLLLRARAGGADAWFAPGSTAAVIIDGRGLTPVVLSALFAQLERQHPGLLDQPAGAWIDAWRQDVRGAVTPRQLLAQLADGRAARPGFASLNPISPAAQLASGPDFQPAGLVLFDTREPEASGVAQAAAAQVLAGIAALVGNGTFTTVLERELWSALATGDATVLLDRRRGSAAMHCCLRAAAADWLRLALQLGTGAPGLSSGDIGVRATDGRVLVFGPGPAALLWMGEGEPPSGLENLLAGP